MSNKNQFESKKYGRVLLIFLVLLISAMVIAPSGCLDGDGDEDPQMVDDPDASTTTPDDSPDTTDEGEDTPADITDEDDSTPEDDTQNIVVASSGRSGGSSSGSSSPVALTGISIVQADETVYAGETVQLTVTFSPSTATNKALTWTSNDTTVATVSSSGLVTSVAGGVANITATSDDGGHTDSFNITVDQTPTVTTATALQEAIEANAVTVITLGADFTDDVTATRTGTTDFTIDFGAHTLTGDLTLTADNVGLITFDGTAGNSIDGNLTVSAASATVNNNINVSGTITIQAVSVNTWNQNGNAGEVDITANGGSFNRTSGNIGNVTITPPSKDNPIILKGNMGGINVTLKAPSNLEIDPDVDDVPDVNVDPDADGSEIENFKDAPMNVTANGNVTVGGQVNPLGSATVTQRQVRPTFDPTGRPVAFGTTVNLTSPNSDGIYYTTDGNDPEIYGVTYTAPITIDQEMTIRAVAINNSVNIINSSIGVAIYTQAPTDDLTNIVLSGTPTGFTFVGDTYVYDEVTVPYSQDEITVTPSGTGAITVNDVSVSSGDASGLIDLTAGQPEIITVNATETGKSTKTYVITVVREMPSTDATLSDLQVDGTTVTGFAADTLGYSVELPYGTTATPTVTATATDSNANVVVTAATDVTSSDAADRTTAVTVTAEDGTTQETYNVTFSVAPNDDATLSDLQVDGTTVTGFAAGTLSYIVELPFGTTATPTVTATSTDSNANVLVTAATDVTSSDPAERTTAVTVTAEDGTTQENYTITFNVVAADVDLSILWAEQSDILIQIYRNVSGTDEAISGLTVDDFILIKDFGQPTEEVEDISLQPGGGTWEYEILPPVGESFDLGEYRLGFSKDGHNPAHVDFEIEGPSSNANLSALVVDVGILSPTFATDTTDYTVGVAYDVGSINVTATLSDLTASLNISETPANSDVPMPVALNDAGQSTVIEVEVTSEDTTTTKTYIITVDRAEVPGITGANVNITEGSAVFSYEFFNATADMITYGAAQADPYYLNTTASTVRLEKGSNATVDIPLANLNIGADGNVTYLNLTEAEAAFANPDFLDWEGAPTHIVLNLTGGQGEYVWNFDTVIAFIQEDMDAFESIISDDASLTNFTVGGEDVLILSGLEVVDPINDTGAELEVADFTGFQGIIAEANYSTATLFITLDGVDVTATADTVPIAENNVIVVTVVAEDGETVQHYKVTAVAQAVPVVLNDPTPIDYGTPNPSTTLSISGTNFTAGAENPSNWIINTGTTNLTVSAITLQGDAGMTTGVTIDFSGVAEEGNITFKALNVALVADQDSNVVSLGIVAPIDTTAPVIVDVADANVETSSASTWEAP
ncbi:MAG: cadherin-like beta sandwich domain-containing protein, partial [Methanolobus sp.]|nr:cadherin-like beta sandwich domain-containing protein [Methanolobus sp.]